MAVCGSEGFQLLRELGLPTNLHHSYVVCDTIDLPNRHGRVRICSVHGLNSREGFSTEFNHPLSMGCWHVGAAGSKDQTGVLHSLRQSPKLEKQASLLRSVHSTHQAHTALSEALQADAKQPEQTVGFSHVTMSQICMSVFEFRLKYFCNITIREALILLRLLFQFCALWSSLSKCWFRMHHADVDARCAICSQSCSCLAAWTPSIHAECEAQHS